MNNQPSNTKTTPEIIAGRYRIQEMAGQGSYSIVYRGFDLEKNRYIALKELRETGITPEEVQEAEELFFNEINILKNLDHPSIPKVYDFFYLEGKHFMVMEWVDGENLMDILEKKGTLSENTAMDYMEKITDILIYLQDEERKIIYKDIKPSNIIVKKNGDLKLIDFGISRFYSPQKKKDTYLLGTPGYAPPEAYKETQTDFSADIYSVGATFYHLTTGEDPFQFNFNFPNPKNYNKELSDDFSSLVLAMLREKEERIGSARELKRQLEFIPKDDPAKTDNTLLVFWILLIGIIIGFATSNAILVIIPFLVMVIVYLPVVIVKMIVEGVKGFRKR